MTHANGRILLLAALALSANSTAVAAAATAGAAVSKREAGARGAPAYPTRPVRLIVPFPPGGGTDIIARLLGQKLTEGLGEQFVVDNRGGAASTLGSAIAARAPSDGHTILFVTATYAISAAFYSKLPYDPVGDFEAVGLVASQPLALVVHPAVGAANVKELIALAKANPGKLNYASGGTGGINHLAGELFKSLTGTRMTHVPYKGAGPALTGLMGGETQLFIATLGSAIPHVRSGKLKALALAGARRSPAAPELPTVAESGVPGYEAGNWYGVLAPRGTPRAVIGLLNARIAGALADGDFAGRMKAQGFETAASTPREFAGYLKSEIAKWTRVVREASIADR